MKDLWKEIPPGEKYPEIINAVVEIPKGSQNKYEYCEDIQGYKLDRVLHSTVYYPGDYGLIPQTLYEDGDPFDILVLVNEPTFPGCVIPARPIAILKMMDDGEKDDKILAVPVGDPNFSQIRSKEDIPQHKLKEISQFFKTYKLLEESKETKVIGWRSRKEAFNAINRSINNFNKKYSQ